MSETAICPETPRLMLTAFEEYMLCDDRPDHPMTGFFRLRFSGRLNVSALEAAVQMTVARHPLVRSRVCRNDRNRLFWNSDDVFSVPLERWSADGQREYPAAGYIDLTASPGTRIWLVEREGAHDLVVQIHHACTDALGMCRLIDDLLITYGRNAGAVGPEMALQTLDNRQLANRSRIGMTWGKLLQMLPGLYFVGRFFLRKPTPLGLASANPSSCQSAGFPSPRTYDFRIEDSHRILAEARLKKMTVNDLLARDLFLALNAWRTENGTGTARDWLRFFVPVNARTADHAILSAANVMGAVFLERNQQQMANPESLLRSIHAEMRMIKHRHLGLLFIAAHSMLRRFPRLRHSIVSGASCRSSCVFSNLGIILSRTPLPRRDGKLVIGDVLLDGVDFIAPLRPLTAAAVCVYTYAGRLSINLHFDPRSISKPQADRLLECFVGQIRQTAGGDLTKESVPVQDCVPSTQNPKGQGCDRTTRSR